MKTNLILFICVLLSITAFSQTIIVLQPGSNGIDAHVDDYNPGNTDNNYPVINAGYNTVGGIPTLSHNFMQFDLSSIPTGATIVSAKLSLYNVTGASHSFSTSNDELLSKVTQSWNESTVTWLNQPSFSMVDTIEIGNTNIQTADKPNINIQSFVQDWVNSPASNYGMVMHLLDEPGNLGRFQSYASSDNADSTKRPKLEIVWNSCSTGLVDLSKDDSQISVFPNPVTDLLHISGYTGDIQSLFIYNMLGQKVMESKNSAAINTSSLDKGFYIIEVRTNSMVHSAKFLKN
ncbi:MAG: DNRLRE domain-containing protein [Chitinophagales bacterium]